MTEFENTKELKQNDVRLLSTKVEKGIFQKNGSSVFFVCLFFFYVRSIVPISVTRFVGHSLSDIHFHFEP